MSEASQEHMARDLVSVADLLRALVHRARWIVGVVVVSVGVAGAFAYWQEPVFEASAKLRVGRAAGGASLEAGDALAARLLSAYGRSPATGVVRPLPYLKSAVASRDPAQSMEPPIVNLVVEAASASSAAELLAQIVEQVRSDHDRSLDEAVGALKESLSRMRERRAELELLYRDLGVRPAASTGRDVSLAWIVAMEKSRIAENLVALDSEIPEVVMKVAAPSTIRTGLLGDIVLPNRPSSPRLIVVLPFAAAVGLCLGILLAFALELFASIGRAAASTPGQRFAVDADRTLR